MDLQDSKYKSEEIKRIFKTKTTQKRDKIFIAK